MTPEEFTVAAERFVIAPAVEKLIAFAFRGAPPERVQHLVVTALDILKQVAIRTVREQNARQT